MASNQHWRRTREYRQWRVTVIRRDKTCVCCGSHKARQAHHLEDGSHNPTLRFDPENGVTLCYKCHMALHCMYKKSYREKCTLDDFCNFTDLYRFVEVRATARVLKRLSVAEAEKLDAA
jgi:hypothetical protein